MRTLLISIALAGTAFQPAASQVLYSEQQFLSYFEWFTARSKHDNLFTKGAELYIFSERTPLQAGACRTSEILAELPAGAIVENLTVDPWAMTEDEINGYSDWWIRVRARDLVGRTLEGYIWGGHVARAWQYADVMGKGQPQLVMLGMADHVRRVETDIRAELRVTQAGRILTRAIIPGLCVFKDCASNAMVRVFNDQPRRGSTIIEAATLVAGCLNGIEKAFYHWNGQELKRVYQAEYTTGLLIANEPFQFQQDGRTFLVRYGGEDRNYNPIWTVQGVPAPAAPPVQAAATVRAMPRA